MFSLVGQSIFFKKPAEPVKPVEQNVIRNDALNLAERVSEAEQELQDLKKMVDKPYDKDTFLFFLNLSFDDYYKETIKEDDWPDVWSEFKKSIWNDIISTFRESFKMGIEYTYYPTKKYILGKFIEAFTTLKNKQTDELLKKCRERYEAHWTKKEIDNMFNEAPENVLVILKLKETYGQEVFWSQIFSDYKPFDAKDWLEDRESL